MFNVLDVVFLLIPFLLAEECGKLRESCKYWGSLDCLKRVTPNRVSLLLSLDYKMWSWKFKNIQAHISTDGHPHLIGSFSGIGIYNPMFFRICIGRITRYIIYHQGGFSRASWSVFPSNITLGTKPIYPKFQMVLKYLLALDGHHPNLIYIEPCSCYSEAEQIVWCAKRGHPCKAKRHTWECVISDLDDLKAKWDF